MQCWQHHVQIKKRVFIRQLILQHLDIRPPKSLQLWGINACCLLQAICGILFQQPKLRCLLRRVTLLKLYTCVTHLNTLSWGDPTIWSQTRLSSNRKGKLASTSASPSQPCMSVFLASSTSLSIALMRTHQCCLGELLLPQNFKSFPNKASPAVFWLSFETI